MKIDNTMTIARWIEVTSNKMLLAGVTEVDTRLGQAKSYLGPWLQADRVVFRDVPPEHRAAVAQVCAQINAESALGALAMTAEMTP